MIDCSGEYWHGDEADDINDYLKAYSGTDEIDVKPVYCHLCGGFSFLHRLTAKRNASKSSVLDAEKRRQY